MKPSRSLRKLIRTMLDDSSNLRFERSFVDDRRGAVLSQLSRERARFVDELERLGAPSHGRSTGSVRELFHEVWRSVAVLAAGCSNQGDAIASCRHSRTRMEANYDRALQQRLPDEMRRVLDEQRKAVHAESDVLNQLQF